MAKKRARQMPQHHTARSSEVKFRNEQPEYTTSCNKNQTGKVAKMKKIAKFAFRLAKGILFLPAYIANPAFGLTDAEKEEMGIKTNR